MVIYHIIGVKRVKKGQKSDRKYVNSRGTKVEGKEVSDKITNFKSIQN